MKQYFSPATTTFGVGIVGRERQYSMVMVPGFVVVSRRVGSLVGEGIGSRVSDDGSEKHFVK